MLRVLIVSATFMMLYASLHAQETLQLENTLLTEREVAVGLDVPWELHWGPNDNIWISERTGKILLLNPITGNLKTLYEFDVAGGSNAEPGLLGLTLHPDFENTPLVYVVYNYSSGGTKERIVSLEFDGESLSNETVLLENIPGASYHNGSRLLITDDLKILMTTGDKGDPADAQKLDDNLNGKVLRLNIDGSMPDDNPIPGTYIYSYGHRNAQGLCFGPNGEIYSSEHGPSHSDEVNLIQAGQNYGWPSVTGPCDTSSELSFCEENQTLDPIFAWTDYCIAPNDLVYYDHPAIPEFNNSLLVAILGGISAREPRISQLVLSENGETVIEERQYFSQYGRLRDICTNPNTGAIYFATNGLNYPGIGPNKIIEYANLAYNPEGGDTDGTGIADNSALLKLFPNPAKNLLKLNIDESYIDQEILVYSYTGQRVHRQFIDASTLQIDLSTFSPGFYYLLVENDNGKLSRSFVVE